MSRFSVFVFAILSIMFACACDDHRRTVTHTEVQATHAVMDAKDFDLEHVIGLVSSGKINNPEELEKFINDPANGINNVDIDHDGNVDWVSVKEAADNGKQAIEFLANPSGDKAKEPVVVASISVTKTTDSVEISGGYPEYVGGDAGKYYHHTRPGLTFGDALFLSYLMTPHTSYVPVYHPPVYVPRPVLTPTAVQSTRTTVRQQTTVAPIAREARPSTYSSPSVRPDVAERVRTQYAAPPTAGGSLKSNGTSMRDFSVRSSSEPRPTGGSFSPTRTTTTPSPAPAPARPTFGGSSAPSRPSFGSSSSPSRPSFGGASRSSSFSSSGRR